jgi:L-iditol 2-dehydrogenase
MNMPKTMLGLFKTNKGPGNMALIETEVPVPNPNEVLIEVKAAGICGTDIHIRHDTFPYWPPVIMGHEFAGKIVQTGSEVNDFKVGDRVVAEPHTKACGKCELCRTGHIQMCASKRSPGWGKNGAFAKYLTMPEHLLHRLPDSISYEEGALVEPAANAVQDVLERGIVEANDFVLVIGPGPIGLLSVMTAKAAGARKVVLVGTDADEDIRLPIGIKVGADETINASQVDVIEEVQRKTNGRGADLVIEASGAPSAIALLPHLVRRLGRITAIGMTGGKNVDFPWDIAMWKVCTVIFNLSTGYTSWEKTIGLMETKKIDVSKIITDVVPLPQWEEIFNKIEQMQVVKAVLLP